MSDKQYNQKKDALTNKQYYKIYQAGKRLTRGAINQVKQQQQPQIEGFDQRKSNQNNKKNKKKQKPRQRLNFNKKNDKDEKPKVLNEYLRNSTLRQYIGPLKNIDAQKEFFYWDREYLNKNYIQLSKFHLPQNFRFFQSNDIFQVKQVELLQKKRQRDFLIQIPGKSSIIDLKQRVSYLAIGHDLVFTKIYLKQFKDIFSGQLQALKTTQIVKQNSEHLNIQMNQVSEQNYSISDKNYHRDIENLGKQSFQQIEGREKSNERLSMVQISEEARKQKSKSVRSQRLIKQGSNQNLMQQEKQIQFQDKIFRSFCLPGFSYILWPCLVYQPMKERQHVIQIIRSDFYVFKGKQKSKLFQKALNFNINSNNSQSFYSNSYDLGEQMSSYNMGEPQSLSIINQSEQKQSNSISDEQIFARIHQKTDSINIKANMQTVLYLLGTQKFILRTDNFICWNSLSTFEVNKLISKTIFRFISEELFTMVEKLSAFHKLQSAQPKDQDLKFILNRLCKYIQPQTSQLKLCIPVRCSQTKKKSSSLKNTCPQSKQSKASIMQIQGQKNIPQKPQQKKTPERSDQVISKLQVLVLDQVNGKLQIINKEVEFDQIRPNFTLPQLGQRQKFLLYVADFGLQFLDFFQLAFASFYFKDLDFINKFRFYCPEKYSNQIMIRTKQRCVQCIYMIYDLPFVKCFICSKYCHRECSQKNLSKVCKEVFQIQNESIWICNKCEPCIICLRAVGNKSLQCVKCKSFQHTQCSKTKSIDNSNLKQNFMCQNCIKCRICEKKLKHQQYDIVNNGYQCNNCTFDIQQKNICPICNKNQAGKWANCTNKFCQRWIHYHCDKYINAHPKIWLQDDHPYYCPICRKLERRKVIIKCIKALQHFDEYQFFIDPDYQNIADYNFVIQNNMCLTKMKALCVEGRYDNNPYDLLLQDFNLLIDNALKYNMPKDQPHYQAKVLNVTGTCAFFYFREVILCSDEDIIYGVVWQKYIEKKKALFKFIYQRYLQLLLNYKAQHGIVEVRRPKQKHEKINHAQQPFVFSSRYIINQIFKSSIVEFKLLKKTMKIQNLFQCPKTVQAFELPLYQNYCFYHPLNSDVKFFCQQCLQFFCCTTECFRHRICSCGLKGCRCDNPQCGCLPIKQKQKKAYQLKISANGFDKRQVTQNYKYCLKCVLDRQVQRVCCYCKSWREFYEFQVCKVCNKTYHKFCQNDQGIINFRVFFTKKKCNHFFPPNVRLQETCYICSCDRHRIKKTQQKIKCQQLALLKKIDRINKWLSIIYQVLDDCGIKIKSSQIINLFYVNYEEFSSLQRVFEQYKLNHYKINRNMKMQKILTQNIYKNVKDFIFCQENLKKNSYQGSDIFQSASFKAKPLNDQNLVLKKIKLNFRFYNYEAQDFVVCYKFIDYFRLNQSFLKIKAAVSIGVKSEKEYPIFATTTLLVINNYSLHQVRLLVYEKMQSQNLKEKFGILAESSQFIKKDFSTIGFCQQKMEIQQAIETIDNQIEFQIDLEVQNLKKSKMRKQRQDLSLQKKLLRMYQNEKDSHASSMKRSHILYMKISSFIKRIFQNSKSFLRKGNTCVLRSQVGNWRVLKKGKNQLTYDITLIYKKGKWIYSINQNSWLVESLSEIIQKTKIIYKHIDDFRDLSQFLGFTIKSSIVQNLNLFTAFLQNNPQDNEIRTNKRKKILQVYNQYRWKNHGKATEINSKNYIEQQFQPKKNKIFYLTKRNQKNQNILQKERPSPPYISYEDLKRDLDDMALFPKPDTFVITQPNNQVFIAPSKIHKLGLFTRSFSPKNTILIQYIGQIIGQAVADQRQSKFHFGCYMFALNRRNIDKKQIIDATYRGNMARYLNHSCDPNCRAKIQVVNDQPRIFIYSIRDIKQYEQLTYDYQFNVDANDKLVCTCGAKNCQGRLN